MKKTQKELLNDLQKITYSKGYCYVIAFLFFTSMNNSSEFTKEQKLTPEEINLLINLMLRKEKIDWAIISDKEIIDLANETVKIMHIMHSKVMGKAITEVSYYSHETAYAIQYPSVIFEKYKKDANWILKNKGFDLKNIQKFSEWLTKKTYLLELPYEKLSDFLGHATYNILDISNDINVPFEELIKIICEFQTQESLSSDFSEIGDFNEVSAKPIIRKNKEEIIIFSPTSALKSIYESPMFWFRKDSKYLEQANKNAGSFVEEYTFKQLSRVFSRENIYSNVEIINKKGETVGEIDVLVIYAKKVIVIQNKSKTLTVKAKQGDEEAYKSDFKKAFLNPYKQALSCIEMIKNSKGLRFICENGEEITISGGIY